jgi:hypothetical protein
VQTIIWTMQKYYLDGSNIDVWRKNYPFIRLKPVW